MHTHHAIDYVELRVTDLEQAKRFYAEAFGWTFNDYGPAYAGIVGPDRELGGLAQVEAEHDPSPGDWGGEKAPLIVLFSTALDASVAAVERAGGRIVAPPFAFPGGRRFHFSDPSGNVLGVWSAS